MLTLTALTAVLGLGLSAAMGGLLAHDQRRTAKQEFSRRTDLASSAVTLQTGRYIDTLRTVAAATAAFTTLTASKYAQVTEPLQDMHLAGATSIAFLVPATTAQSPAIQALWRARGVPGLVLHPVGNSQEHIFSIYATAVNPLGRSAPAGTDASQAAAPKAALDQARRSGQITVSDTYQLISDQGLPVSQRQFSFVLSAPVYEAPDTHGRRAFRGWVLMGMHGQDFMGGILKQISQNLLDVTLHAENADGTVVAVAALRAPTTGARDLNRVTQVDVANRRWQLDIQAHGRSLPGAAGKLPITVTTGGSLLALLLAAFVYLLLTDRDRAQARVRAATADLLEQKTLLEAIMDSVGEGIVVIDHHGEFILTNPAAAPYLTVGGEDLTNNRWNEHVQLFRADGVTAFPAADLPTSRALAGESSHGVEIFRRKAGAAEVVVSVSARPLDRRAGRKGAVSVFHDITARKQSEDELARTVARLSVELARREQTETELRGREAELTTFAGMVSHDLKAPLRAVSGFTQILRDDLNSALPGGLDAACSHSIERIISGTQRMGQLIDDLLTFASSRDRPLRPQPVDLQVLVADVVAECTNHLRDGDSPEGLPVIDIEPLPTVHVDPVMCRQLLDNLIGNALKYTVPSEPARIQISAHVEPGLWIRIEIADCGVGIPAGKHEQVFLSFNRAHAGYTGTGLGLAICQRIVERHGGTIGARDNPGGGSRFHFTLPTSVDALPRSSPVDPVTVEPPVPEPRQDPLPHPVG